MSKTIDEFLRKLVYKGLDERYPSGLTETMVERVEYELSVIGICRNIVVVWDFINYAKLHKIPVGPGKDTAGSIVAYAIKNNRP